MITNFIWENKWKALSFVSVIVFFVLVIFFRSEDTWKNFAKWLIQKKKELLKEKVSKEKNKIKESDSDIQNIDKKLKKIEKREEEIEKSSKNKNLDEIAKEIKNMGY